MMPLSVSFVSNVSFHGTSLSNHGQFNNNVACRRPIRRFYTPTCKAKSGNSKPKPSSNSSDPFSSFAAGPSAKKPRRLSRKKETETAENETSTSSSEQLTIEEGIEKEAEQQELEQEPEQEEKSLIAVKAIGSDSNKAQEKNILFSTRKTAQDFIDEGIVDDIDEESLLSASRNELKAKEEEELKKEEEIRMKKQKEEEELKEKESVGKLADVTGDGNVQKTIIKIGTGNIIESNSKVKVEYVGKLEDGTIFDSSRERNDSFTFELGTSTVIKGWEAGISTMKIGEISEFIISPLYAYGKKGMPPVIPGNSTLIFEIELLQAENEKIDSNNVKVVADLNPDIPRTAQDIAKSYDLKMESNENNDETKKFFEKFYFISPFMSQTGERPPWWLNPVITFSLIAICTAIGFYFVYVSGAIHIGYVDEPVNVNIFK